MDLTPELKLRLITAAVLAAVAIAADYIGGIIWSAAIVGVGVLVGREWHTIITGYVTTPITKEYTIAMLMTALAAVTLKPVFMIGAVAAGGWVMFKHTEKLHEFGPQTARWLTFGLLYVLLFVFGLAYLRAQPDGAGLVVWLIAVVAGMDTGAYFVGKSFGGKKLCPSISPNKTISGLVGGLVVAGGLGVLVADTMNLQIVQPALVAVVLALVSHGGDIFVSWHKRQQGLKDTGALLPGHGGVLDRLDGYILTAPLFAWLITLM